MLANVRQLISGEKPPQSLKAQLANTRDRELPPQEGRHRQLGVFCSYLHPPEK